MCNRHVAGMIADLEAARLEADEKETERQESRDSEQTAKVQSGLLMTLRSRLAR